MKTIFSIFFLLLLSFQINYSQVYPKNVLLEEFSTAPCGFCPEGAIIAEKLINKYPNLFTFTHHAGFGTDSMTIPESAAIAGKYTTFAPAGVIDRGYYDIPVYTNKGYLGVSRQKWDSVVAVRLNEAAEAYIKVNKSYDNELRTLNVKVDIGFISNVDSNDYRVNLAIIEDSVTGTGKGYDQKNYFNGDPNYPELYKKGDSIVGYVHRHVLRALPTGTWGAAKIIPYQPEIETIYTYELKNYKIPAKWKIKDLSIISFISYYNKDSVVKHKILNSEYIKHIDNETKVVNEQPVYNNNEMEIYPNPAQDLAYAAISLDKTTILNLGLYSIAGQKIRDIKHSSSFAKGNIYFYVSDLQTGVYILRAETTDRTICRKFVVEK
ncbi:MAG: outer membrane protein Omp28 [Ignavibacteria bacterium]|nr:outer membrane protein Omp28 [Ignavibacteria bacterium]